MAQIKLKDVRLSFPELWTAKPFNNDSNSKPAFNAAFLFPKGGDVHKLVSATIQQVARESLGAEWEKQLSALKAQDRLCLRDGDIKSEYEGYEGMMYLSSRSYVRPTVKDKDGKTPLLAEDGRPYGGCYVNALVDIWYQSAKSGYGQRINAGLSGVQFLRDGDAFTGTGGLPENAFEDLSNLGQAAPAGDGLDGLL